jgi:hypothetical protein
MVSLHTCHTLSEASPPNLLCLVLVPKNLLQALHLQFILLHLGLTRHQLTQQIVDTPRSLSRLILELAEQQQLVLALVNRRVLDLRQVGEDGKV